jgi:hypothetical protein
LSFSSRRLQDVAPQWLGNKEAAMPDWSIKIVGKPGEQAKFVVDSNDVNPGDPLVAATDDLVSWNNTTDDTHRPWPANSDGTPILPESAVPRDSTYYLSDLIPPRSSSRPSWLVPKNAPDGSTTMRYCCLLHPNEQGQIIISNN